MTAESVVITVPPGTAHLYLPGLEACPGCATYQHDASYHESRVWVGVPELPTVGGRHAPDYGWHVRPLGPGDPVVLAEHCLECDQTLTDWGVLCDESGNEYHIDNLLPLVSACVADDDQPAIVRVAGEFEHVEAPYVRSLDGRGWLRHVDADIPGAPAPVRLPGVWSGATFAVRVAGAEDYQP